MRQNSALSSGAMLVQATPDPACLASQAQKKEVQDRDPRTTDLVPGSALAFEYPDYKKRLRD